MARGVAILLMFVYHFSWDLTFFGYADFQLFTDPFWMVFARFIVAIILLVMGVAQIMARERGPGLGPPTFFRRLGVIALCAGLVSAATYVIDAGSYIFFGVLHHVVLASFLLAGAVLLPSAALIALAAFCFAAPWFLSALFFAAGPLLWVGLAPVAPVSVDYVPLLPWFGIPLLGLVLGRLMIQGGPGAAFLAWHPTHPLALLVRWVGRHSLLLYMIHQPILWGGLYGFAAMQGRL
jgi:uncharacterized membrane protein